MPGATTKDERPSPTHRLKRMIVQEVSLVDKAANMRVFLLRKRADDMKIPANAPVKKEDAGTAAANVAAGPTAPAADASTAAAGSMQAQVKDELTNALADGAEKIVAIANMIDGITVSDQPQTPPVPTDVLKQIGDVGAALTAIAAKYGATSTDPAAADGAAAGSVAQNAAGGTPATAPAAKVDDKEKKPELGAAGVGSQTLAKAGRRMAKERLDRFAKAIDTLISLMRELQYDDQKRAKAAAARKAEEPQISNTEIAAVLDDAETLIGEVERASTELATTKSELTAARKRLEELESMPGLPNALQEAPMGRVQSTASSSWNFGARESAPRW